MKRTLGTSPLGSVWAAVWQETEVAARVLSTIEDFVPADRVQAIVEREVAHASSIRSGPSLPALGPYLLSMLSEAGRHKAALCAAQTPVMLDIARWATAAWQDAGWRC